MIDNSSMKLKSEDIKRGTNLLPRVSINRKMSPLERAGKRKPKGEIIAMLLESVLCYVSTRKKSNFSIKKPMRDVRNIMTATEQ